jgi:hypothetical protein
LVVDPFDRLRIRGAPDVSDAAWGCITRLRLSHAWYRHALRWPVPAIAVVLACCGGKNDPAVAVAVERTVPARVQRPYVSSERKGQSLTAEWRFESEGTVEDYTEWVSRRLNSEFTKMAVANGIMVFSRHLDGDSQTIRIEAHLEDRKVRVHVIFQAIPF